MNSLYRKTIISIVIVYLVILAGGIVRMTGSGMGCPDWPKCFGFLIPPTERSQLEWKSNSEYNKNQIVIIDEKLFYANDKIKLRHTMKSIGLEEVRFSFDFEGTKVLANFMSYNPSDFT